MCPIIAEGQILKYVCMCISLSSTDVLASASQILLNYIAAVLIAVFVVVAFVFFHVVLWFNAKKIWPH